MIGGLKTLTHIEDLVQLLLASRQKVGPEKEDYGWVRWNEIALSVMGQPSSYLNG